MITRVLSVPGSTTLVLFTYELLEFIGLGIVSFQQKKKTNLLILVSNLHLLNKIATLVDNIRFERWTGCENNRGKNLITKNT